MFEFAPCSTVMPPRFRAAPSPRTAGSRRQRTAGSYWPLSRPLQPAGSGTAVLHGNLLPDGAVIKQSAATASLLTHRRPGHRLRLGAGLQRGPRRPRPGCRRDLCARGPQRRPPRVPGHAGSGQPSVAPPCSSNAGVTDIVRISDARMSGTAYGTIVLHVAPEAAIGGPPRSSRRGTSLPSTCQSRTLDVEVGEEELRRRRDGWRPRSEPSPDRGYAQLFRGTRATGRPGGGLRFPGRGERPRRAPRVSLVPSGPPNSVAGTALVFGVVSQPPQRGVAPGPGPRPVAASSRARRR